MMISELHGYLSSRAAEVGGVVWSWFDKHAICFRLEAPSSRVRLFRSDDGRIRGGRDTVSAMVSTSAVELEYARAASPRDLVGDIADDFVLAARGGYRARPPASYCAMRLHESEARQKYRAYGEWWETARREAGR